MGWDNQAYSFGYSNARPFTPRRTPTIAVCTSPGSETRWNVPTNSSHSGLKSTFPEDYSESSRDIHLSGNHSSVEKAQKASSFQHGFYPTQPSAAELVSPVENISYGTGISLPAVDDLCPIGAALSQPQVAQNWGHDSQFEVTPQRQDFTNSRATSQVATSPESRGHSSRASFEMMQDPFYTGVQLPQLPTIGISTFPTSNVDIFGFPVSAPATVNISSVPLWAADISMSGTDTSFDNSNINFIELLGRRSNSFNWGRNTQAVQDAPLMSFYDPPPSQAFDFNKNFRGASIAITEPPRMSIDTIIPAFQDPFAFAPSNCGLGAESLLGLPATSSVDLQSSLSAPTTSAPPKQYPLYSSPKQESQHVEKAYLQSCPASAASLKSHEEKSPAAAVKAHLGIVRSMSDIQGLGNGRRYGQNSIKTFSKSRSSGQVSPINERSHNSLSSIPEIASKKGNPSIIFTIDANGRARTETSYNSTEKLAKYDGPSKSKDNDWPTSETDSLSDEDLIMRSGRQVPLQRSNFFNKCAKMNLPKRPHPSPQSRGDGGFSRVSLTSKESHREPDCGVEAVHDDDNTGDATSALRKVMRNRQKSKTRSDLNARRLSFNQNSRRKSVSDSLHQHRRASTLNFLSQSQSMPGSTRSISTQEPTRCICDNTEDNGLFWIQCESCANWLHGNCVSINERNIPVVYVCAFCAQTPLGMRAAQNELDRR